MDNDKNNSSVENEVNDNSDNKSEQTEKNQSENISGSKNQISEKNSDKKPVVSITPEDVASMIRSAISEYAEQQKREKSEAEKLAGMNDQQKAEFERDNYRQKYEQLQKQMIITDMQKTARNMLAEKGIHLPDNLIAAIVTENAETTKQNVESFSQLFSCALEDAIKERLKGTTPKNSNKNSGMTREQILAIKDDSARVKAIKENIEIFNN